MRKFGRAMIVVMAMVAMVGVGTPTAFATDTCPHMLGSAQRLQNAGGAVVQEWTVTGLQQSADTLAGYSPTGRVWAADVAVSAVSGTVTPIIPNFAAVSRSGARYPVLWQIASANGISGATIAQGQTSSGKLYFDVTGDDPMAVIYADGSLKPSMMWMDMPMGHADMPMAPGMPMPEGGQSCPCCEHHAM